MKLSLTETILIILLIGSLLTRGSMDKSNELSSTNIDIVNEYLVNIKKKGKKKVIVLVSGTNYINKQPVRFIDRKFLEIVNRELNNANYTVITLTTPCSVRCINDYTRLSALISQLEPEAVIYKGIHSDNGTNILDITLKKANIPIYIFGTEIALDYTLYVGPNNEDIGKSVYEGLEKEIKEGDKAIYIETTTILNNNKLDNGFKRINEARKGLEKIGVETVETVSTLWSKARTYEEIYRVLNTKGRVNYIIAPSIETGEGAVKAIEDSGYSLDEIKVIAMDFTETGVKLLNEGKFYGLVSHNLSKQALTLVDSILMNEQIEKEKRLYSTELITLKNINNFKLGENIYKW